MILSTVFFFVVILPCNNDLNAMTVTSKKILRRLLIAFAVGMFVFIAGRIYMILRYGLLF